MSRYSSGEYYCGDCGCLVDDEICPRCRAEWADYQSHSVYRSDRRWNGEVMARRQSTVNIVDMRLDHITETSHEESSSGRSGLGN